MQNLQNNLQRLEEQIHDAAVRAGTSRQAITLVAVTKGVEPARIDQALQLGIEHIGENRVQEAVAKHDLVRGVAQWHMIGHLQTNKAASAEGLFSLIHSLDRMSLLNKLAQRAQATGHTVRVLVQVNTSGESTKSGVCSREAEAFILTALSSPGIRVEGLMTIGPLAGGPDAARPGFAYLWELAERIRAQRLPGGELPYLSMGMSGDFAAAILEGANIIRVGTAIFGPREDKPT